MDYGEWYSQDIKDGADQHVVRHETLDDALRLAAVRIIQGEIQGTTIWGERVKTKLALTRAL